MFDQQACQLRGLHKVRCFLWLLIICFRFKSQECFDPLIRLDLVSTIALILERIACGFLLAALKLLICQDSAVRLIVGDTRMDAASA
jgi:hypothetical protein